MTSSRLPGKVLLPLAEKPALERLIERLARSVYIDQIVVATTTNADDDPIIALAERLNVGYFRGSEFDVLGRVLGAAKEYGADIICEVTGDCPALDHRLIDRGVEEFFSHDVDYCGNVNPLSLPIGFDSQVFPTSILDDVSRLTQDPIDRVHVSYYIYRHPERFRLFNWSVDGELFWPELRITLDEQGDYELLQEIFTRLLPVKEDFSAIDVIRLLREHPELVELNKHIRQKEAYEG